MCPFLRDSLLWDYRDNLRPTNSGPISLCQPAAVKVLLAARDRSQLIQKWDIVEKLQEWKVARVCHRVEGS